MTDPQTIYTVTAILNPAADTSSLLRVVSVLHGRHTIIHRLTFDTDQAQGPTVTTRISLTNAGWVTLQHSLRRIVDVLEVVAVVDPVQSSSRENGPVLGLEPTRQRAKDIARV